MSTFQVGDVVALKAGGPPMTIEEKREDQPDYFACCWFEGRTLHRDFFDGAQLVESEPGWTDVTVH